MLFEDIPSQSVCSTVAYSGCVYAYAKDSNGYSGSTSWNWKRKSLHSDYWKEAFALKDKEAVAVAKCLVNEVICHFGVPHLLCTDQGRIKFELAFIREICQLLGIEKIHMTPYHPQLDGLVEHFNRTLLNMLNDIDFKKAFGSKFLCCYWWYINIPYIM